MAIRTVGASCLAAVLLVACRGKDAAPAPAPTKVAPPPGVNPALATAMAAHIDARCLPVVAKACGCVYACAKGISTDGKRWTVTSAVWKGRPLAATIEPWCVGGVCTDAFAAELVCDGICAPKPADATCHMNKDLECVGA